MPYAKKFDKVTQRPKMKRVLAVTIVVDGIIKNAQNLTIYPTVLQQKMSTNEIFIPSPIKKLLISCVPINSKCLVFHC